MNGWCDGVMKTINFREYHINLNDCLRLMIFNWFKFVMQMLQSSFAWWLQLVWWFTQTSYLQLLRDCFLNTISMLFVPYLLREMWFHCRGFYRMLGISIIFLFLRSIHSSFLVWWKWRWESAEMKENICKNRGKN